MATWALGMPSRRLSTWYFSRSEAWSSRSTLTSRCTILRTIRSPSAPTGVRSLKSVNRARAWTGSMPSAAPSRNSTRKALPRSACSALASGESVVIPAERITSRASR